MYTIKGGFSHCVCVCVCCVCVFCEERICKQIDNRYRLIPWFVNNWFRTCTIKISSFYATEIYNCTLVWVMKVKRVHRMLIFRQRAWYKSALNLTRKREKLSETSLKSHCTNCWTRAFWSNPNEDTQARVSETMSQQQEVSGVRFTTVFQKLHNV